MPFLEIIFAVYMLDLYFGRRIYDRFFVQAP